jgi:nucleoside 2-deoxyribosyltransferase
MRVYIAADSFLQADVKELRDELVNCGVEVTSRWIDAKLEAFYPTSELVLEKAACDNFSDIDRAVFLVAYNPMTRHKSGTGGRHVEMGYALAKTKTVLYVGEKLENVFHRHPGVIWVSDISGISTARSLALSLHKTIERLWNREPSER